MNHYQVIADDNLPVGGDFIKGDGTGSFSIYGDKFPVCIYVRVVSHISDLLTRELLLIG